MGLDDSEQLWSRGEKRGRWFCKGEEGTLEDLGAAEGDAFANAFAGHRELDNFVEFARFGAKGFGHYRL